MERPSADPPADEQTPATEEEVAELDDWLEEGLLSSDGDYRDKE